MKAVLVAIIALVSGAGTSVAIAQQILPLKTPRGDLQLTITGTTTVNETLRMIGFEGFFTNSTSVEFRFLQVELLMMDQRGVIQQPCNSLQGKYDPCTLWIGGRIGPGKTARLVYPGNVIFARNAASSGTVSRMAIKLIEATYSPCYIFGLKLKELPGFEASFTIDPDDGIAFVFRNKLESPIEIIWDESSFINERDESSRLVHAGMKYIDKDRPQPNSFIPPLAKLTETAFPASYISFAGDSWKKSPLLPTDIAIQQDPSPLAMLVGKALRLYLRLMIEGKKVDYLVSFPIEAVRY